MLRSRTIIPRDNQQSSQRQATSTAKYIWKQIQINMVLLSRIKKVTNLLIYFSAFRRACVGCSLVQAGVKAAKSFRFTDQ